MSRGVRGATTVLNNDEQEIVANTKTLLKEMIAKNNIKMDTISHIFISATEDINAVFPAKALREIPKSTHVPVMCMRELAVPNSLEKCIRVMMVVNTNTNQQDIQHIFHNEAIQLRPDLIKQVGE